MCTHARARAQRYTKDEVVPSLKSHSQQADPWTPRGAQQPLEPPHRVGRSPTPLLAAAGGARRQGLLLHEKEAPWACLS